MVGESTHDFFLLPLHIREVTLYPHRLLHHFLQEFSIKLTGLSNSHGIFPFFFLTALVDLVLQL